MTNSVLMISKPVSAPWNDSNKNLVRDVSSALAGTGEWTPRVMVPAGAAFPNVENVALYRGGGRYAPSRLANARVLLHLLFGRRADVWHFFFQPNPLTLKMGSLARWWRRTPCVHTIASAPDNLEIIAPKLFADVVITLSRHTAARLDRVGRTSVTIPPAIGDVKVSAEATARVREKYDLSEDFVLFAGDLEFGNGAVTFLRACARDATNRRWILACRPKTVRSREALAQLQVMAAELGVAARVRWLGELDDIHAVVAAARVLCLVSDTLHAKMDWPLVILEALLLGTPAIVSSVGPAAEMAASGGVLAIASGDPEALLAAVDTAGLRDFRENVMLQARNWVLDQCGPARVAGAHAALYSKLIVRR